MPRTVQYTADVSLVGLTSLLIHKYVVEDDSKTVKNKKQQDYSKEWRKATHVSMDGSCVIIPSRNIEMAIRSVCPNEKVGKTYLNKVVPTGIDVAEFEVPILDENDQTFDLDDIEERGWLFTTPVVIGKNRVVKTRTCIPKWKLNFSINVLHSGITPEALEYLIDKAGYMSGLGVWRPSSPNNPGKFGQFEINNFHIDAKAA